MVNSAFVNLSGVFVNLSGVFVYLSDVFVNLSGVYLCSCVSGLGWSGVPGSVVVGSSQ